MKSAIYVGEIAHQRNVPKVHRFRFPFFMWFLNLDELDQLPDLGHLFSAQRWAISRMLRSDYLGDPQLSLADAVRTRMLEITGRPVSGQVYGLMNMRTLGLYFSPVNFYYVLMKMVPSLIFWQKYQIPPGTRDTTMPIM